MKVKIIKSPAINAKKWKKGEDGLYIDGENDTLQQAFEFDRNS